MAPLTLLLVLCVAPACLAPATAPSRAEQADAEPGRSFKGGRLRPEEIQQVVRSHYDKFRSCYEQGLRRNPTLEGRVSIRFVIATDGSVTDIGNGGSDMPDVVVIRCIIRLYREMRFPQPEGGIVTVVYPIMFSPGDDVTDAGASTAAADTGPKP